ncbi:MAG: LysM peptidoglycan-binding domain-containing protein [Rhodospirillales bacterium]|nr:LysM peptidoglycan-binding domain-containing protein [Rhodospirillales bacterium]
MSDLKITIDDVLAMSRKTEIGNHDPYALSHAGTKNSGYSIGAMQVDLSIPANQFARATLVRKTSGQHPEIKSADLDSALATKGKPDALSAAQRDAVNAALKTKDGQGLVAKYDRIAALEAIVGTRTVVESARINPRYKTDSKFRATIESKAFQALVADNANQYGSPTDLARYVKGRPTLKVKDGQGNPLQLDAKQSFGLDTFVDYQRNYSFAQDNQAGAKIMRTRMTKQLDQLAEAGAIDQKQHAALADYVQRTIRANGVLDVSKTMTVKAGDTLSALAHRHGTTVNALMSVNPHIKSPNAIRSGDVLALPAGAKVNGQFVYDALSAYKNLGMNFAIENGNSLGPSAEFSPEDAMTPAQNRAQLARNASLLEERRAAARVSLNLLDATPYDGGPITISGVPDHAILSAGNFNPPLDRAAALGKLRAIHPDPLKARTAFKATLPEQASLSDFAAAFDDALANIKSLFDRTAAGKTPAPQSSPGTKRAHPDAPKIAGLIMDRPMVEQAMRAPAYANKAHPLNDFATGAVKSFFGAAYADNAPDAPRRQSALEEPGRKMRAQQLERIAKQDAVSAAQVVKDNAQINAERVRKEAARAKSVARAAANEEIGMASAVLERTIGVAKIDKLGDNAISAARDAQNAPEAGTKLGFGGLGEAYAGGAASYQDALARQRARARATQDLGSAIDTGGLTYGPKAGAGGANGSARSAAATRRGQEALYGEKSSPGSLGTAGKYDAASNYTSGTTSHGNSTGGVDLDGQGREIGAYGQFTRDIVGRKNADGASSSSNTRVICTELVRQGRMAPRLQRLDVAFTLRELSPVTVRGYHVWAVPYVRLMRKSKLATALIEPVATWRALEIAHRLGERDKPHHLGKAVRWVMEPLCWLIGHIAAMLPGDPERFHPVLRTMKQGDGV